MYRIATVCTGNICRSPMAELALRRAFDRAGLADHVTVDSAGISDEEHGNPIDPRAQRLLKREGLNPHGHRAQQFTPQWFGDHDLILAMDTQHARALASMAPHDDDARGKVRMYRSFDPAVADLPAREQGIVDPWYGNAQGFEQTWEMVTGALDGIVEYTRHALASSAGTQREA
ncbi:low molecular weight protein-tyrosine-phosphatase [Kocuria sp.]|uniref:low molecular weight protein-tyrosine-phosphatase n=1 Tax=Kocuria sp. TaxID=1871328 RepID=UPI0026E11180|nr:low molecular weight protein-tyrosine-phosphatase [Kocuria sp.]MDO5618606.1 low molecular weight protein-tyrosine-phosphatase [Kocuria sp.]